jgi:phenylalanyl-tRNA synthetase beta chain
MKIPISCLKSFIDLQMTPGVIAETLTLLGIEVDRIENEQAPFSGVVLGQVLSTAPHPNAAKLTLAEVSDGKEHYQIVCGADNCRSGLKTAFAKVGALVKGKRIEKAVIRGIESFGMLCSEEELGLPVLSEGIMELPSEMETGRSLLEILWDPILEISLTPNLGHCMSALGIARELSTALTLPLKLPKVSGHEGKTRIQVEAPDFREAPRYMCRLIEGVSIGPSPFWLQRELAAAGMKPISNAVDIANYILLLYGQPLHVFDYDKLEGALHVGVSDEPKLFLGLDGIEREIPIGTLLISDEKKPVAIAGILGGANSAVGEGTKRILIEAAVFDPTLIRRATKKMGLRTESSQRFEKGVDPNGVERALDQACLHLGKLCGGQLASGQIDWKKGPFEPRQILCRVERVNGLLGTRLSSTEIEEIFKRLGFSVTGHGTLQVRVPALRSDVCEEIDLIEEAARIYGYNRIEKAPSKFSSSRYGHDPAYLFEKEVREKLLESGLQEFLNSDLIGKKLANSALEWIRKGASLLTAVHAKTEEYSVLRPSLLPGLLQASKRNFNQKTQTIHAFEIGRIHFLQEEQLIEEPMAALILTGKNRPSHWSHKSGEVDFFDLKGHLENLIDALKLPAPTYRVSKHVSFHPGRQADICFGDLSIGSFGEIHPTLLDVFDIKQRILYAEINLHLLMQQTKREERMKPLPQFPTSERDLTLALPMEMQVDAVFHAIRSAPTLLLEKAELIDLYIPETSAEKNATFRFTYRDPLKTISFEEVENGHRKITEHIHKQLAK